jgi:hypothetical protein
VSELKIPVTESLLRESVLGRDKTLSRHIAMGLFRKADLANKETIYKTVLENKEEDVKFRYLAAIHLGKMNTPAAKKILSENSKKEENPEVLGGVVMSLGFIGGRDSFPTLKKIAETAFDDQLKRKSRFAATMVAYRFGLKEFELKAPDKLVKISDVKSMKMAIKPATVQEKKFCLASLKDLPVGFEYDKKDLVQFDCLDNKLIFLRNKSFLSGAKAAKLAERKAIFGLIATKSPESNDYSPAFIVFTSPATGDGLVNIVTTRITGEIVSAGVAKFNSRNKKMATFETNGVDDYGVNPVYMTGEINDGNLVIKSARSALIIPKKRIPRPLIVTR